MKRHFGSFIAIYFLIERWMFFGVFFTFMMWLSFSDATQSNYNLKKCLKIEEFWPNNDESIVNFIKTTKRKRTFFSLLLLSVINT